MRNLTTCNHLVEGLEFYIDWCDNCFKHGLYLSEIMLFLKFEIVKKKKKKKKEMDGFCF
jgi:hypothetical protein